MGWLVCHSCIERFDGVFMLYLSGTQRKLTEIGNGKEKIFTAQVLRNWYTFPGNVFKSPNQFIFTRDHFAPVETVLRENTHFLGFEKDIAKFIALRTGADVFNLRKNPIFIHPNYSSINTSFQGRITLMVARKYRYTCNRLLSDSA